LECEIHGNREQQGMTEIVWWKDVVPPVLGVAGFALSVFNFWKAANKDKRQIKVSMGMAMVGVSGDTDTNTLITLEAVNVGHRQVTVGSMVIELGNGKRLAITRQKYGPLVNPNFPIQLTDGQNITVYVPLLELKEGLLEAGAGKRPMICALCTTTSGEKFRSEKQKFEL
jgi:hypothetical protein